MICLEHEDFPSCSLTCGDYIVHTLAASAQMVLLYALSTIAMAIAIALGVIDASLNIETYSVWLGDKYRGIVTGSALAFSALICANAISIAFKKQHWGAMFLFSSMLLIASGASIAGSFFALHQKNAGIEQELIDQQLSYDNAQSQISIINKELVDLRHDRNIASTGDAKTAQRLLKVRGLYEGEIDGILGPQSSQALVDLARTINSDIKNRESVLVDLQEVLENGRPEHTESIRPTWFSMVISVTITLFGILLAFLSNYVVSNPPSKKTKKDIEDRESLIQCLREANATLS